MGGAVDATTHAARLKSGPHAPQPGGPATAASPAGATSSAAGAPSASTAAVAPPAVAYPASLITVDALDRLRQPYLATDLPPDDEGSVPGAHPTAATGRPRWLPPLAVRFWGHETEEVVPESDAAGAHSGSLAAAAATGLSAAATSAMAAAWSAVGRAPAGSAAQSPAQPRPGTEAGSGTRLQRVQRILTVTATGVLSYWELKPYATPAATPEGKEKRRGPGGGGSLVSTAVDR